MRTIAKKDDLTICFAHVAYRMAERFALRATGIKHFQVGSLDELTARIAEADVLSVSMMWRNELIARNRCVVLADDNWPSARPRITRAPV